MESMRWNFFCESSSGIIEVANLFECKSVAVSQRRLARTKRAVRAAALAAFLNDRAMVSARDVICWSRWMSTKPLMDYSMLTPLNICDSVLLGTVTSCIMQLEAAQHHGTRSVFGDTWPPDTWPPDTWPPDTWQCLPLVVIGAHSRQGLFLQR